MRILLINPENPESDYLHTEIIRITGRKTTMPALGVLTAGALLPEEWPKKYLDLNVKRLKDRDIKWADYIFLGGVFGQQGSIERIVSRAKKQDKKIVAGGLFFTSTYQLKRNVDAFLNEFKLIDHFILDEAEITLPEFLKDLSDGNPKKIYSAEGRFADMRTSPMPLWGLVELGKYQSVHFQIARGCPNGCEFCSEDVFFGSKHRSKEPDQIIRELDELYAKGWRGGVFIVDSNFTLNRNMLKKTLLPELSEWQRRNGFPFEFNCHATIDIAGDVQLLNALREAGFRTFFIGIETTNKESLKECGKYTNMRADLLSDVKTLFRSGFLLHGSFIIGFDNDNEETIRDIYDFIKESGILFPKVHVLCAPPGTKLYDRMKNDGRIQGTMGIDIFRGDTNIRSAMGNEKLKSAYMRILSRTIQPDEFLCRARKFLAEYNPHSRDSVPILTPGQLMLFFRIIREMLIKSGHRGVYMRMFKTLKSEFPDKMRTIIMMLIIWHDHISCFRKNFGLTINSGDTR